MDHTYQRRLLLFFVLLAGFLGGTVLPELLRMGNGTYAGFFSMYSFRKFEEIKIDSGAVFLSVAAVRVQTLLFLWMSSYTAAGLLFHLVYAWWLAASAGMLLALFALRDGYHGLILFGCCLMPQWIVYTAMWRQEAAFFLEQQQRKRYTQVGNTALPGKIKVKYDFQVLLRLLGLCLLGSAVEAYLGLWTLKIFLQIFV